MKMKTINRYINEKLRLSAKPQYTCQPESMLELQEIIKDRVENVGNECDLNDIDVSKITNMSFLFNSTKLTDFNGNVSLWDVSNVTDMSLMFYGCEKFNCDLSMWDVSNVRNMKGMFLECKNFNGDITNWDTSNVTDMTAMFYKCGEFNQDISKWDVSNVKNISSMFYICGKFKQNLNAWNPVNITSRKHALNAFFGCPTTPKWYNRKRWEDNF
jgi:surface protein